MNNYDHEIYPEDRGIRKFLWYDYFHDSVITNIAYRSKTTRPWRTDIIITLQCERESRYVWEHRGDSGSFADELYDTKYTYYLTFSDVKHHSIDNTDSINIDYVNGRFKDSSCKRALESEYKIPLYHFRIQLSGGFMDIIFRKFKIRKSVGRVNYDIGKYNPNSFDLAGVECEKIHSDILNDNYENEFWILRDLRTLYHIRYDGLPECLRHCIKSERYDEDIHAYSAYLLGKLGAVEDLPLIRNAYFRTSDTLKRRHIMDAIENLELKYEQG